MSMSFTRFNRKALLVAPLVCLVLISPAWGIVLHDEGDAPDAADRPNDAVVGRWSNDHITTKASCVAVGKDGWGATDYILTCRHQGGGVGNSVFFGGVEYIVAEIWNEPAAVDLMSADLRVCRIRQTDANGGGAANLTNFVQWYTDTDERNKNIVIGGFGMGKGNDGTGFYYWDDVKGQQRWGTNRVDNIGAVSSPPYQSDTLIADFDAADCSIADGDSGGGWFIDDGGVWKVAALGAYASYGGRSYWSPSVYEDFQGVRLSSYGTWLNQTVPEPGTLTLIGAGGIGLLFRRRRRRA